MHFVEKKPEEKRIGLDDKLKSNKEVLKNNFDINFYDSAFICSDYLPSPIERLKIYKKINLSNDFKYYFLPGKECKYFKAPCTHINHDKIKLNRKFSYNIISKKN